MFWMLVADLVGVLATELFNKVVFVCKQASCRHKPHLVSVRRPVIREIRNISPNVLLVEITDGIMLLFT